MLRKIYHFLFVIVLLITGCKKSGPTYKTLTLQPMDNPTEMTVSELNGQDASAITSPSIDVDTWTSSSEPWVLRGLIQFDLSSIPAGATIDSAYIYLYSDSTPVSGNLVDANFGTSNSFTIEQVTSAWATATTTWFTQPTADSSSEVVVPGTTLPFLDVRENVTSMVMSMVKNNSNYGFLLKLQTEVTYNSRIFVSSYNTTYPDGHPKLVVGYHY